MKKLYTSKTFFKTAGGKRHIPLANCFIFLVFSFLNYQK